MRSKIALGAFAVAATLPAATIGVSTSTPTELGVPLTVSVNITDISDLYAFQFDLAFAPGILFANEVTDGGFLGIGFFPGFINNTAGTISSVAGSLTGPVPGVGGSGVLSRIAFVPIATGTSPITLSNVILLDSALNDITADVVGATVRIVPTVVPEPATFVLLAFGTLAMSGLSRWRRRERPDA
jgi:hypothetical protein